MDDLLATLTIADDHALDNTSATATNTTKKLRSSKPPVIATPLYTYPTPNDFGWVYNESLPLDNNYMDLASLTARSSLSLKGNMGAVLVRGPTAEAPNGTVLKVGNNVPFFPVAPPKTLKSCVEIHAEANVLTSCARLGIPTAGTWMYITFPPCKDCFMLLVYAGVKRVVFRRNLIVNDIRDVAAMWGIEIVERGITDEEQVAAERCSQIVRRWEEGGDGDAGC
ncbi:hypothetical protein PhCBS80983_g02199 [Powellomyces hirtus]|uniref:CMP/dCMP-type deaminase domain-containing protein n=1 Tax=Powellomyces hirtus TaxID=109895 RepID=A0A507E6W2_9FUNG|nr:hypothetical protein PhCBS80983_g02199 [Powellomyces hirtus]